MTKVILVLTDEERERRDHLCAQADARAESAVEFAVILMQIKSEGLYREEGTWKEFVEKRWSISTRYANLMVKFAEDRQRALDNGAAPPKTESEARKKRKQAKQEKQETESEPETGALVPVPEVEQESEREQALPSEEPPTVQVSRASRLQSLSDIEDALGKVVRLYAEAATMDGRSAASIALGKSLDVVFDRLSEWRGVL